MTKSKRTVHGLDHHAQPWERQPKETPKQWRAFCAYRELGPERTVGRAASLVSASRETCAEWSYRWKWVERVAAWDNWLDKRVQAVLVTRETKTRERHMGVGKAMQSAALMELHALLEMIKAAEKAATVTKVPRRPVVEARDMVRLGQVGVTLERLAMGASTENVDIAPPAFDTSRLSTEELRMFNGLLKKLGGKMPLGPGDGDEG